jgi:CPA1 family monovalent cation:H+ antiporter
MNMFEIFALLLTLSALFSYINKRLLHLPDTIGVMFAALVFSLLIALLGGFGIPLEGLAQSTLQQIDFSRALLHGALSFLLFAGALHVNLDDLLSQKWIISLLATVGVALSTLIVGVLTWWVFGWLGFHISLIYCLLFGALISPTDPLAVLAILKSAHVPKSLEAKIAGESLFNDGIGVVLFLALYRIAVDHDTPSVFGTAELFIREVIGGAALGLLCGGTAYWMLKNIDDYKVEILITIALAAGGYALADAWHLSGPITIVVAGLLIGNKGRVLAMSDTTRERLDQFWELMEDILNAMLFVLIGLETLMLPFSWHVVAAGLLAVPIVLSARLVSVAIPVTLMRLRRRFSPNVVKILTWGGLRGGISVALALSLPMGTERQAIVTVTYAIVVFSILVQGLTLRRLI